jgi:hypothetical protein
VKIHAAALPARGLGAISPLFIFLHKSKTSKTSSLVRSVIWVNDLAMWTPSLFEFANWPKIIFLSHICQVFRRGNLKFILAFGNFIDENSVVKITEKK